MGAKRGMLCTYLILRPSPPLIFWLLATYKRNSSCKQSKPGSKEQAYCSPFPGRWWLVSTHLLSLHFEVNFFLLVQTHRPTKAAKTTKTATNVPSVMPTVSPVPKRLSPFPRYWTVCVFVGRGSSTEVSPFDAICPAFARKNRTCVKVTSHKLKCYTMTWMLELLFYVTRNWRHWGCNRGGSMSWRYGCWMWLWTRGGLCVASLHMWARGRLCWASLWGRGGLRGACLRARSWLCGTYLWARDRLCGVCLQVRNNLCGACLGARSKFHWTCLWARDRLWTRGRLCWARGKLAWACLW